MMKESFYKKYQNSSLNIPKTYYFDCSKDKKITNKMTYPLILKPSNVIMYNHLSFEGKNKIYQIYNKQEETQLSKFDANVVKEYNSEKVLLDYEMQIPIFFFDYTYPASKYSLFPGDTNLILSSALWCLTNDPHIESLIRQKGLLKNLFNAFK